MAHRSAIARLAGADEDRTMALLRALRSDLIDPTIAVHHGSVVKRTGVDTLIESAAWSTPCAARLSCSVASTSAMRSAAGPPHRVPRRHSS